MLTIRLSKQAEQPLGSGPQSGPYSVSQQSLSTRKQVPGGHFGGSLTKHENANDSLGHANESGLKEELALPKFPRNLEVSGTDIIGYKVVRRTGEKVHFCTQCNFPIASYGRLEPCLHAFCLTCAKAQEKCYLCDSEITKVSKVDRSEGLYICGAPGCLQSFFGRSEFADHMRSAHPDLCQALLPRVKVEPVVVSKSLSQGSGLKRPRTTEPMRPRQDPTPAAAPSTGAVPGAGSEPSGGGIPAAARPSSSQQQRALGQEQFDEQSRGAQPPHLPQGPPGPFPTPRMHGNQGPPDFHQGHLGPMGMQGPGGPPGMGPMMGPMDARGPGPMGPHWGEYGPMGGPPPFMDHPSAYRDMQFSGPRGSFRPGGPEESGYGWGGGNQSFGPGPGFAGGWRPPQ